MPLTLCTKCGRMHYGTDPCPATKSTAARKDVHRSSSADSSADSLGDEEEPNTADMHPLEIASTAGTQAPPVDTPKRGRPRTIENMKVYKADHERKRRAKLKAAQPAPKT